MKLSEQYLERVSHSTEFSKPVVLTKHMELYGQICRWEGKLSVAENWDLNEMKSECEIYLSKIAKENNLKWEW